MPASISILSEEAQDAIQYVERLEFENRVLMDYVSSQHDEQDIISHLLNELARARVQLESNNNTSHQPPPMYPIGPSMFETPPRMEPLTLEAPSIREERQRSRPPIPPPPLPMPVSVLAYVDVSDD
jgi:hypothetical protein